MQLLAGLFLANPVVYHFGLCHFSSHLKRDVLCNFPWGCVLANLGLYHLGPCCCFILFGGGKCRAIFRGHVFCAICLFCSSWAISFSISFERGDAVHFSTRLFLANLVVYHLGLCHFLSHLKRDILCNFPCGCVLASLGLYHLGPCCFVHPGPYRVLFHLRGEMLCSFQRGCSWPIL